MRRQRILRRLNLAIDIPRYYLRAASGHGWHPLGAARSLYTALHELYWPEEAFQLGLLVPGVDARKEHGLMSKARMVKIQAAINPVGWEYVLSDKGIFARWALAASLPTPRFLAWCFPTGKGSTADGRVLSRFSEWRAFLETETPREFVVKPARSSYGDSVRLYKREGSAFFRFDGTTVRVEDICTALQRGGSLDSMIIQERVRNHPDLVQLSGAEGLQTARIVTVVGRDGTVHLVSGFFKPIVGQNEVDNYKHGLTGNLVATVSFKTGRLGSAVTIAPEGGIIEIQRHPETGVVFQGFRLPFWEEACALAQRAALAFLPVRLVGFDMALTPEGPLVIEGNFWPDPPTLTWPLEDVMATLRKAVGEDLGRKDPGRRR